MGFTPFTRGQGRAAAVASADAAAAAACPMPMPYPRPFPCAWLCLCLERLPKQPDAAQVRKMKRSSSVWGGALGT